MYFRKYIQVFYLFYQAFCICICLESRCSLLCQKTSFLFDLPDFAKYSDTQWTNTLTIHQLDSPYSVPLRLSLARFLCLSPLSFLFRIKFIFIVALGAVYRSQRIMACNAILNCKHSNRTLNILEK